jgi:hypothetical protein
MTYTGGCRCGAVRFSFEAEPLVTRVCWCRDCQYIAAGSGAVNAMFPTEGMTVEGETADFASVADSGTPMHRRFCPRCGTPLFSQAETRPHMIAVRVGALDDPQAVRPEVTIWTVSAPSWACIAGDAPTYERQPPPPVVK